MIEYFTGGPNFIQKVDTLQKKCWVNITNPSAEEIDKLVNEFKVPSDFINDILDIDESSRSEIEGRWLLIILKIPIVNIADSHIPFITIPFGILMSNDFFLTICGSENEIVNDFKNNKVKRFDLNNNRKFVLQIFLKTSSQFLKNLKDINRNSRIIETKIQESVKNAELLKLLEMEKSLVYFNTSLKSNELMLERLKRSRFSKLDEEDEDLIEDVIIENKQAIELTSIYTNILNGTMDAFASIISNNQNLVMKTLTSITIMLMIPTMVTSFYGMNVRIPYGEAHNAYLTVIGISIVLSILGVMYFRKKDFF